MTRARHPNGNLRAMSWQDKHSVKRHARIERRWWTRQVGYLSKGWQPSRDWLYVAVAAIISLSILLLAVVHYR